MVHSITGTGSIELKPRETDEGLDGDAYQVIGLGIGNSWAG